MGRTMQVRFGGAGSYVPLASAGALSYPISYTNSVDIIQAGLWLVASCHDLKSKIPQYTYLLTNELSVNVCRISKKHAVPLKADLVTLKGFPIAIDFMYNL